MAASVRIEDEAFSDDRYAELAHYAGLTDADHALAKMTRLWRQCTIEQTHHLSEFTVQKHLGPNGVDAIVRARLGVVMSDGRVRIRGTKGRIEWLRALRENGKKGGRPPRVTKKPSGFPPANPSGSAELNPPAPAPAPALKNTDPATADAAPEGGLSEVKRKTDRAVADKAAKIPDRAWKAADYLREQVLAEDPNALVSKQPWGEDVRTGWRLGWANEIRLMVERDKRTYEQIAEVLRYVFTEQIGDKRFVVQSADALREKFDRIQAVRRNRQQPEKPQQKFASIPIAPSSQRNS